MYPPMPRVTRSRTQSDQLCIAGGIGSSGVNVHNRRSFGGTNVWDVDARILASPAISTQPKGPIDACVTLYLARLSQHNHPKVTSLNLTMLRSVRVFQGAST